jgi:DNA-binding response OmpR family regulator
MRKLMIIDDEKDFCKFVKMNLEYNNLYEVIIENDGKRGIKSAIRNQPDIILLDLIMPGLSGYDVLKVLKTRIETMSIPVVMLTAIATPGSKEKSSALYDEDYIVKPILMSELKSRLDEVIARRG